MSKSYRVAVAFSEEEVSDVRFGQAEKVQIYDLTPNEIIFREVRYLPDKTEKAEGKCSGCHGKDDEFVRITKTRFHRVLKGQIKNPGVDFIPKFCKIAGVSLREFYDSDKGPDELTYLLDDEEKNLILTIRLVKEETGDDRLIAYLQGILEGRRKN